MGNFIVAGGFGGNLTAFSFMSLLAQAAPNKGVLNDLDGSPLEIGFWNFTDLDTIEDTLTKKMDDSINFMEKDGTWFLVISNNKHCEILVSCSDIERNCMQAHATSCKVIELIESSGNCMQAQGTACKLRELHASSGNCMQAHGPACKLM